MDHHALGLHNRFGGLVVVRRSAPSRSGCDGNGIILGGNPSPVRHKGCRVRAFLRHLGVALQKPVVALWYFGESSEHSSRLSHLPMVCVGTAWAGRCERHRRSKCARLSEHGANQPLHCISAICRSGASFVSGRLQCFPALSISARTSFRGVITHNISLPSGLGRRGLTGSAIER